MRYDLHYGLYRKVCFTNPLNRLSNESYDDIIETEFPSEYNPEMSYQTKSAMHNEFMYILMEDTQGWMEDVKVKDLRDPELKEKYIEYYSCAIKNMDYILNFCPAQQININALPRSMNYKATRYTYTLTLVQKFYYYYYNRRFQVEYGIKNLLPVFLPAEPVHHYHDIIQARMEKLYPTPKRRKR